MELGWTEIIVALIGTGAIGAGAAWMFGGRQNNKNIVDNDSHQREVGFHKMVEEENEKMAERLARSISSNVLDLTETCKYKKTCIVAKSIKEKIRRYENLKNLNNSNNTDE